MLNSKRRVLTLACVAMIAMLAMPATSYGGLCDWLFGCCKPKTCAAPVAVAPTCGTCVPQTCGYMPTTVYRALYAPAAPCGPCGGAYAMTTYRPAFGWASQPRLVAYTTYQPVVPAAPCAPCNTCVGYSPCSACASGVAPVTYAAPAPTCSSCQAASPIAPSAPVATTTNIPVNVAPAAPSATAAVPTVLSASQYPGPIGATSQGATIPSPAPNTLQKPATETIQPIPEQPGVKYNSLPIVPNPGDRTASRAAYPSAPVVLIAAPVVKSVAGDNDGWQPANE